MIEKIRMTDPPGMLTVETYVIPFFMEPLFGPSWTVSHGPGIADWIFRTATRLRHFEPYTKGGAEYADQIRNNMERR